MKWINKNENNKRDVFLQSDKKITFNHKIKIRHWNRDFLIKYFVRFV